MKWLRALLLSIGLLGVASVAYPQAATWQVGNFMETTLSANITSGALTIGVASIPTNLSAMTVSTSSAVYAVLEQGTRTAPTRQEIVRVTGVSGLNLTVVRGQDGTTAQAFNAGDRVSFRLVRYIVHDLRNRANSLDGRATSLETRMSAAESTLSSGIAPPSASYVTMGLNGTLTAERVLTATRPLALSDGGANGNATLSVDLASLWPRVSGIWCMFSGHNDFDCPTNIGSTAATSGSSGNVIAAAGSVVGSYGWRSYTCGTGAYAACYLASISNRAYLWRSTSARQGNFILFVRFAINQRELQAGSPDTNGRIFMGVTTENVPVLGAANPGALTTPLVGMGMDDSDSDATGWSLFNNDAAGTPTKTTIGEAFVANDVYELTISTPQGGASFEVEFFNVTQNRTHSASLTTDIPGADTQLRWFFGATSDGTAAEAAGAATILYLNEMYVRYPRGRS